MLQTLGKNTNVTALIALKPRQVMLATLNMKHDNKACSADQKTHLLHSILQFLQRNGFSKTVKKFRSEAKIDEDGGWNGCPLDLEDMYYKCLETCGHANTKVDSFKEQDLQANDITKKNGDGTRVVSEGTVSMKKKKRNGKSDNDNVAIQPGPVDRFSKAEKSEETLTNILVCESNMESKEKKKSKKSIDTVGIEAKQVSSDGLREPADGTACESRLDESNKKLKNKKEKKSKLVLETSVDNTERHQLEALASTIDNKSKNLVTSEGKSATASDINSSSKDKKKKKGKTLSDSIVDDVEHSDAGDKQVATTIKEKVVEDSRDYRVVNTTNDILLEEKNVKSKSKKRKKDGLIFENLPRGEPDELKKGILTTDSKTDDFQTLEKDETNKENKGSKKRKRLASEEKDLQTVNKVAAEECKRRKTEDMKAFCFVSFPFWLSEVKIGGFASADMYGGDEVSAIVVDLGSHTCKAGYAGEDAPKAVFPTVVGSIDQMEVDDPENTENNSGSVQDSKNNVRPLDSDKSKGKRKLYVGSQALAYRRDHMEVLSPLKDGIVVDWDIVDSLWDHAFRECLLIDPKEHPMLLAEPSSSTQQQRERTAELMFEKYKVPAIFLAKNAVLTSFASGRATSLVVDSGGGSTTVAPVHDGYVIQKAVATSPIGGEILSDCLMNSLESKGIKIKPRYSFKRKEIRPGELQTVDLDFPSTTESYKLYSQRIIASDIKETVCRFPDTPYDDSAYSNMPTTPYELPDGQIIEVGADRFKIPDVLFNPSLVQTIPGMESFQEVASSARGLPQMVIESINKCDVDIRRELFSSILLAGGTTSMQQFKERLEKELIEESPQAARVKVLASGNAIERRFSVWIGGSILASLGSFQQMWFSKTEYEEHGASYIQRKCP